MGKQKLLACILLAVSVSGSMLLSSDSTTEISYFSGPIKIKLVKGDITKQKVEAIVNAANPNLLAGGGVCGAIFAAAGSDQLQDACNAVAGGCAVGDACITSSFDLQKQGIKHIIHAVGPDCRIVKDSSQRKELLKNAYGNSLRLADEHGLKSIAFPFISSAIYACPKELASQTAIEAILSYSAKYKTGLTEIDFVLFTDEDFVLYKKLLDENFALKKIVTITTTTETSLSLQAAALLTAGCILLLLLSPSLH